jgi:hypothetical protein
MFMLRVSGARLELSSSQGVLAIEKSTSGVSNSAGMGGLLSARDDECVSISMLEQFSGMAGEGPRRRLRIT